MLVSFTVSGFRSFVAPAHLYLRRETGRNEFPDGSTDALPAPVAVLCGHNAAGKSTFAAALQALAQALSSPQPGGLSELHQPSVDSERPAVPTCYELEFLAEGVLYRYRVEMHRWGVATETLTSLATGHHHEVLTRVQASPESGVSVTGEAFASPGNASTLERPRPHDLVLALAMQSEHPILAPIGKALHSGLGVHCVSFQDTPLPELVKRVAEDMVSAPEFTLSIARSLLPAAGLRVQALERIPGSGSLAQVAPDIIGDEGPHAYSRSLCFTTRV